MMDKWDQSCPFATRLEDRQAADSRRLDGEEFAITLRETLLRRRVYIMRTKSFVKGSGAVLVCGLVLAGCAARSSSSSTHLSAASDPTPWRLSGARIIACCCNTPCPCRMNYKPTHCHGCDSTTAVHIDKGDIGGVDMAGMDWVVVACSFAEDKKANWNYVYVSDKASDEQLNALKSMFAEGGKALGEKYPYLAGRDVGMRKAPIKWTVSSDKREWSSQIPGILELKTRSIVLPGRSQPVMSTGIFDDFGDKFIHADCVVHTYNDPKAGYKWELAGKQCNQADFSLTSERVAKGDLTWACWSAHADLGDAKKTQYQEKAIGHK